MFVKIWHQTPNDDTHQLNGNVRGGEGRVVAESKPAPGREEREGRDAGVSPIQCNQPVFDQNPETPRYWAL